MKRKRHGPEPVIRTLREAGRMLSEGKDIAAVCQALAVSEATFHRWRNPARILGQCARRAESSHNRPVPGYGCGTG